MIVGLAVTAWWTALQEGSLRTGDRLRMEWEFAQKCDVEKEGSEKTVLDGTRKVVSELESILGPRGESLLSVRPVAVTWVRRATGFEVRLSLDSAGRVQEDLSILGIEDYGALREKVEPGASVLPGEYEKVASEFRLVCFRSHDPRHQLVGPPSSREREGAGNALHDRAFGRAHRFQGLFLHVVWPIEFQSAGDREQYDVARSRIGEGDSYEVPDEPEPVGHERMRTSS